MTIQVTQCSDRDPQSVANHLRKTFAGDQPRLVLYFASSNYEQSPLAASIREAFPNVQTIGCSTAGEIVSGAMLKNSVVAMAFGENDLDDVAVELVQPVSDPNALRAALDRLGNKLGKPVDELPIDKYVGLVLIDGMSVAEEKFMDALGNWVDITFIGGSAGDDVKFKQTWVHANGTAMSDAALLAVIKPIRGFDVIKTQSFCSLGKTLRATRVDEERRTVLEFDGMPAVQAYAAAVGAPIDKAPDYFMSNPVGLMVSGTPYVRSPQQVRDGNIVFYCAVKEGMRLEVLQATDIVKETQQALQAKKNDLGSMSALINFNCILRTLELESKGQTKAYGELFRDIPTIGFSTYGEEYCGHINQTATMLVLK